MINEEVKKKDQTKGENRKRSSDFHNESRYRKEDVVCFVYKTLPKR